MGKKRKQKRQQENFKYYNKNTTAAGQPEC